MPKTARDYLELYNTASTDYWRRQQQRVSLEIFRTAAKRVPAYQKFLRANGIKPTSVKSFEDFTNLPAVQKNNYFQKYKLAELVQDQAYAHDPLVMTATSGSTGKPTYFPRSQTIDWQYSVLAEFFLNNGPKGATLLINCFGMGVWIGGVITYEAFHLAALRGQKVTVITPGINKKEIFHALRELAPVFPNVILAGYPPFIKDVLSEAKAEKIQFSKFRTRLLFAAESFTEDFRLHVCNLAGIKNLFADTLNIYGSAELGAMAFETPGSIFIRRLALKSQRVFNSLFPQNSQPTLAQYNPEFVSFEEQGRSIFITANSPCPFVRYQIGDTGGVYTLEHVASIFSEHGIDLYKEAKKQQVKLLHLPFVFVHVRDDFSTKLYGAIIHPQHIQDALEKPQLKNFVTGKFTCSTKSDRQHNQFLEINVELKKGVSVLPRLARLVQESVVESLLKKNAEYKNNYQAIPKKVTPVIQLWEYESPNFFAPGIKQKWVIK